MKKFILIGFAALATGLVHADGDTSLKRRNIAAALTIPATEIVRAYYELEALCAERLQIGDFQNGDFTTPQTSYFTPGDAGTLCDFVFPSLDTFFKDVANAGRNKQILLKMKK